MTPRKLCLRWLSVLNQGFLSNNLVALCLAASLAKNKQLASPVLYTVRKYFSNLLIDDNAAGRKLI
jgi:hypothetical protein